MRKRCIALVLCLLTLAALAGCGESSAKTVTSNGVECYRVDGVCYPAVFGEPQLTGEEITALLDGGDTAEMAVTVSTVLDALRLLKARQQDSEDIDSQDAETTLLRGSSQPRGWVDALLYLLAGDYEESGRIDLYSSSNYSAYAAIAQDGLYYAFDPFEIRGDRWLVLSGENYVNADAQKLADMLRTACGFSTSAYTANAYPVLSKEEQEQRKAFEQREYTDEEIQALADAGISFAEACEKISTVADAAQFLEARGYSFAPDDAGIGAALRYQLNNGGCVGTSALFGALLATMMIPGELFTITNYQTIFMLGWQNTYTVLIVPFLVSVFYIYLLRQNFLQIPNELYLAAKVDGTSDFKYLWKVMVPLSLPTLISITILKMMGAWNSYVWPRLVANDDAHKLITNGLRNAFNSSTGETNYPVQMAAVAMVSFPLFLVFIFLRKYIMSGVSRSGIKG